MTTVYVQFADSTKKVIVGYFTGPQDPASYPNQGTVLTTDTIWATYYNSLPKEILNLLPPPG